MSDEYFQAGQRFSANGASLYPARRKNRNALGVAASLFVLATGALFVSYVIFSSPERLVMSETDMALPYEVSVETPPAPAAALPAEGEQSALTQPESDIVADAAAPEAPRDQATTDLVKQALAESRAARAVAEAPTYAFSSPSIKPVRLTDATVSMSDRITPIGAVNAASEKPAAPVAPTQETDSLYEMLSPAVFYAGDIGNGITETTVKISRGENFVDALKRAGVSASERHAAAQSFAKHFNMRRLMPGQQLKLKLGWPNQTLFQLASMREEEPRLVSLSLRDGFEKIVTVDRIPGGGFKSRSTPVELTTHLHAIEGRIEGSLYVSAKELGAPDDIIAGLANAFAYDVDFQREIRGGDEFELVFEAQYDDRGVMAQGGEILYARLNWRGKSREKGYYRFEDDRGFADYYDAAGQGAKRLLMKTPIDGARLSSRFGTRRHPILGYARQHKGVDFAAPRGTPIKAAGDGVVERADRYGSFGNYIRIRHANGYKTAYAHLKGFKTGIRKGKRVRQGDIIGYVGTTGRSTGPHLHYEVHLNGKAVNPQKLKIATGKKLTGAALERFQMERERIDLLRRPAPAEEPPLYAEGETPPAESL